MIAVYSMNMFLFSEEAELCEASPQRMMNLKQICGRQHYRCWLDILHVKPKAL